MNITFDWSGCFGLGDDEIIYRENNITAEIHDCWPEHKPRPPLISIYLSSDKNSITGLIVSDAGVKIATLRMSVLSATSEYKYEI